MSKQNKISYPLLQPNDWYDCLEKLNLGVKTQNSIFQFDKIIGNGQLQHMELMEGLWVQQMNFTLHSPFHLLQLSGNSNDLFIINFYLTNAQIKLETEQNEYDFQYDSVSIMLSSAMAISKYDLPANEAIKIFQIGFSKKWLHQTVFDEKDSVIKNIFVADSPIYISENLSYKFKHLLMEMDLDGTSKLHLFSNTFQLLNSFFETLENRNFENQLSSPIHHTDMEQLIKVRTEMDSNPLKKISLEELSQSTAMSLSKFKRLFKQVFGLTPYNYHLKNKLTIAMEMIQNKKYSISEVGIIIGYSNLSQFAKAFKNEFGVLPSEIKI